MRNIAKCKLCESIIESFHENDYVECKCGEISVSKGPSLICSAKDWNNFKRVDDQGNEIVVSVKEKEKPKKKELLDMLQAMIDNIEKLPSNAMHTPVNHYDLLSALLLILTIFRSEADS